MSTKAKILEPPRKTEVQKTATTQVADPIVKKEHAAVATESLGKELASKPVIDAGKGNDPNIIVPKQTPEEIAQRNVSEFRKWYETEDGLTDEEREKRDKARAAQTVISAIGDGLSSIANLHYTTQYAPNIEFTNGIEQLRNRWYKEDAERKAKYRESLSLYQQMQAAKRAEDEIKRRKEREKIADERYEEEKKYRAKKDAEAAASQQRAEQWAKEKFNKELEADNKRHEATLKNQRVIEGMRQQEATDKNSIPIFLSETEEVRIPKSIWNNKDRIAEVYEALPAALKEQAVERYATKDGEPHNDFVHKKELQKYKPMTWQQMQQAIGAFLADPDATKAQNIVRRLAGEATVDTRDWSKYKDNGGGNSDDLDSLFVD